ncbi:CrcB family protein [Kocuria sp.]|uniref:FluC/FEX family fluoride channel n=1 Tax=Kocuria sp. TaxID=1871328 RepID=UPI0026DA73E3|nr:CrcB family protein [Kocuria sp.]MDO4918864.1 CrcB family protein [Kocuria sp.]
MTRTTARDVLWVGLGGAAGSLLRWGVAHVLPSGSAWHWPTLSVNLAGALLLGFLLEFLTRPGTEGTRARTARLLLGTGLLGGFTTYSTFAQEVWDHVDAGTSAAALGYTALSIVGGLLAAAAGIALGAWWRDRRTTPPAASPEYPAPGAGQRPGALPDGGRR